MWTQKKQFLVGSFLRVFSEYLKLPLMFAPFSEVVFVSKLSREFLRWYSRPRPKDTKAFSKNGPKEAYFELCNSDQTWIWPTLNSCSLASYIAMNRSKFLIWCWLIRWSLNSFKFSKLWKRHMWQTGALFSDTLEQVSWSTSSRTSEGDSGVRLTWLILWKNDMWVT